MSNKNLKVYRIQFVTELKQMAFKVKFPCQIKIVWKRSNETTQSTPVPVTDGIANFNQTLKLYVNMYYDTTTNKFVQKKCMYSFLIITEKGEKSAGSITYDLSQFFNRRVYEIEDDFSLQKCPLPDTKMKMKIFYEQSSEQGYDSMSRISSASQQMDMSSMSVDLSELEAQHENQVKQQKKQQTLRESVKYEVLSQSDVGSVQTVDKALESEQKPTSPNQQIVALSKITGKINDFVDKCSQNIRNEVENLKFKLKEKEEILVEEKLKVEKLQKQNSQNTKKIYELQKQAMNTKEQQQVKLNNERQKVQELEGKLANSERLCSQLENSMSEKGEAQSSYLSELKANFHEDELKLKKIISSTQDELLNEKKQKNDLLESNKLLEKQINDYRERLKEEMEKNKILESKEKQRERQLEEVRMKMEDTYERMVASLSDIMK